MATSVSGYGSGIDFGTLIDSILADRSRPVALLQSKSSSFTSRSNALKQLNTKLAVLTSAAKALTDQELGTGRLATSSAGDRVSVSATSSAGTGTIGISVSRLATSLTQNSKTYASSTDPVLAGVATSATFELRKGGATTGPAITIDSTNNTLEGLRDAINDADAGVTAIIVDTDGTGSSNKLVLTSNSTGAAGRVELVETSSTGTATDIALASTNPPGATTDFSDLDASFSISGVQLTRSENTVTDAVSGVTLKLKDIGNATITLSDDTSDIESKIRSFTAAYNDVQDFITAQYARDSAGKPTGALASDPTLRTVQEQIRDAVGGSSTINGGTLENLTQLGIGRDQSGKLTLDSSVLSEKLSDSMEDVRALLAGKTPSDTGIGNQIYSNYDRLSDSINGVVQTAIDGYQGTITSLTKSINDQVDRLAILKASLTRQFAAVDAAISQLNSQNTSLTSLLESFNSNKSKS